MSGATIQVAHPLSDYCCLILLYKVVLTTHYCLRACLPTCPPVRLSVCLSICLLVPHLTLCLYGLVTLYSLLPCPVPRLGHVCCFFWVNTFRSYSCCCFSGCFWQKFSLFGLDFHGKVFHLIFVLLPFWHSLDCVSRKQTLTGICFCFQFYALITLMNTRTTWWRMVKEVVGEVWEAADGHCLD